MKKARRVGGLLALGTLLALVSAHTVHPEIVLQTEDKLLLTAIVSALLGVDILAKRSDVLRGALSGAIAGAFEAPDDGGPDNGE
jgi:hypothetical protein